MIRNKTLMACLWLAATLNFSPAIYAQVSVQGGRGESCLPLVSKVMRRWFDVKRFMLPPSAKLRRPKKEDFFCVSPYSLRNVLEHRVAPDVDLRCYPNPATNNGPGICCDQALQICIQLRPDVIPEVVPRTRKKTRSTGSNSNWVTPPSEKDQWKTIPR